MKTRMLLSLLVCSVFAFPAAAQDSKFRPTNQQIPVPECLNTKGLWDASSKPCTLEEHKAWLADITHWRKERLIRIGYDGSRYDLPALQWTQSAQRSSRPNGVLLSGRS